MSDDPFTMLVVEALNLMHPRFARANGLASIRYEFYHQFRHLWDRALPVQLGLGHVVVQSEPEPSPGPTADFLFWRLGERGAADERLGAVSFARLEDTTALDEVMMSLSRVRKRPGYAQVICIVFGSGAMEAVEVPGVAVLHFDLERWRVRPDRRDLD